jgi:pimeloyl-ACP methyl ester carboxylesterase
MAAEEVTHGIAHRMAAERRAQTIRMRDGRALAYAEWGPVDGRPLLHFHGVPDGRFNWGAGCACEHRGLRLVTVDRPGVGGSDPKPGRCLADWATDVQELTEQLGVDRFSVSGLSAGGAYALACAARLQERVQSVALISSVGRLDQPGFVQQTHTAKAWWLAAHLPRAMALLYSTSGRLMCRSPTVARKLVAAGFPKIDREIVNRPEVAQRLQHAYIQAARSGGGHGLAEDMQVLLAPWGFDPTEIPCPVFVFHGKRDAIAPPTHAQHWTRTLPDARAVWFTDAGHFLIEDHAEEILDAFTP